MAGVHFSDTLQITVTVGSASLVALLDFGSSHNFISESAARRTGLPLLTRSRLSAMVANCERITCPGVLRQAAFTI